MYLQLSPRVHRPFWKSRQMPCTSAAGGIQVAAGGGAPGAAWTYLQLSPRVHRPFWKSRHTSFRPKFGGGGAYIAPFGGGAYMTPFGGGIW